MQATELTVMVIGPAEEGGVTESVGLNFGADGQTLLPVVVQEDGTNEVLWVAHMNRLAFEKTLETGLAHFWSRSRNELWLKGATSGEYLHVREVRLNCNADSLLLKVTMTTPTACHTGHKSCYYRTIEKI